MRSFILLPVLFLCTFCLHSQSLDFGIAATYGTNFNQFGGKIYAGYTTKNQWVWQGDFTIFNYSDSNISSNSATMINAIIGYDILADDEYKLYPMLGINLSFLPLTDNSIDTKVGLNAGAAFEYAITDWVGWNSQIKYTLLNPNFTEISSGIIIHL